MVLLRATSYASDESCEVERKCLNGEIDVEDGPDDDVSDTNLSELLLARDTGWTQDINAAHLGVANVWRSLKTDLMRAQLAIPTAVEKLLHLSREVLVFRDDI